MSLLIDKYSLNEFSKISTLVRMHVYNKEKMLELHKTYECNVFTYADTLMSVMFSQNEGATPLGPKGWRANSSLVFFLNEDWV